MRKMEAGKEKQISKGRGSILLKMIQEKEKAEAAAIAAQSTSVASNVPETSVSSIPIGRGKSILLNLAKAKLSETSSPKPVPLIGQGRAALLNQLKPSGSVRQPIEQSSISEYPSDNLGVLGKLSDISIQDTTSTSKLCEQPKPIPQKGTGGKLTKLNANYIRIRSNPEIALCHYEIKFSPDIDSRQLRSKLVNQHLEVLGRTKAFDGTTLYLPRKLKQDRIIFESKHPMDGSTVTLTLIFKKVQNIFDNSQFFNVLLKRVMRALSLIRIGQHSFNPKGIHSVPQHKLEVWPGYVAVINEYEAGLMLTVDARHRVMRTETIRDIMINFGKKPNFKDLITRELVGLSVFTRYNNKNYRVDDIAWDKNPTDVFVKGNEEISLISYYKQHWNIEIKDTKQPLIVHRALRRLNTGERQEHLILLVPELCYLASLSDSIRSDYRVMKDLDALTKMSPNARRDICRHFVQEIQNNDVPRELLAQWGLSLETDLVEFTGRILEPENIYFGNNRSFQLQPHKPADWGSIMSRNTVLRTPNLNCWCILYYQKDTRCTQEFIAMLKNVSKAMGICVRDPQMICLRDDRIESYLQGLRNNIHDKINLVTIIFPTNRTDRYSAVKRVCCAEMPVPSQVIMSRTISRGDKLKSVTEKIALQINCKLGGALWALSIPMENCMICGIDVYHAGIGQSTKGSVAGFVASLDRVLTSWHSKVCLQGRHQEIVDMLQICMISAIKAYYKYNTRYPDRIIVYRDGVSDSQIETVVKYEVKQLLATFKNIEPSYQPALTVIIVQKRINTRLFARSAMDLENPSPGVVVDSYITKSNLYDFYLVSQNIRQGTVSPTHYIVVYDSKNMKAEHIQRLTYKLCHLYYNWPGTVKVPAPCQYAHKLVSLVGQNIQLEPHQLLSDTLYYL